MSMTAIIKRQREILDELVLAGVIKRSQANSMAPSESMKAIIQDIQRMAGGREEEISAAVGKVLSIAVFSDIEEGRGLYFDSQLTDFVIYDSVVFTPNPMDKDVMQKAGALVRNLQLPPVSGIGVIGAGRLASLRQAHFQDEDGVEVEGDPEIQKERALKLVTELLREAANSNVSDIHLQPSQSTEKVAVRFRIDGRLRSIREYPFNLHASIYRVIVDSLSKTTVETIKPQDVQFMFELSASKNIEIRVSTMPVKRHGDTTSKIVMRLLANNRRHMSLRDLGFSNNNIEILKSLGELPAGLVLVTGPTGSGKTATLASVLLESFQNDPDLNYHTLEDPVEMRHEGMTHTECGKTLSFADALRSLLRQDPDVVLVGEMRDHETAMLSYQAAMTGHLVFSTLHTRDSHRSIDRLLMLDIPRDILATNTTAIIAQRLIGKVCQTCRVKTRLVDDPVRNLKYGTHSVFEGEREPMVYKANPSGCADCRSGFNGMKGRTAIIEILRFTAEIQDAILDGRPGRELRRSGLSTGSFADLWADGLRLVKAGVTTLEELESCLEPFEADRSTAASDAMRLTSVRSTKPVITMLHPTL